MRTWELALALVVGLTLHDLASGLLAGLVASTRLKWAMKKYPEMFSGLGVQPNTDFNTNLDFRSGKGYM
jgi:hypothetical protein